MQVICYIMFMYIVLKYIEEGKCGILLMWQQFAGSFVIILTYGF